ncbi:MAG: hypothetical protein HZA93_13270 [Verrucomicrobia bacterium]|nr:hypothetical protein [Verrucomicrobiota bacterium]
MPLDSNLNHTRAEIQGTVRLLLSLDAASKAAAIVSGFEEFSDLIGTELQGESKTEPVLKPINGVMRQTDETPGLLTLGYELTTRAIADARKLKYFLAAAAGQDLAQAAINAQAADNIVFSAQVPAVLNRWYDVLKNGARVRQLSAFAIAGKVEGVDFIVDYENGAVRFPSAAYLPAANVAPTISAPAIDAAHAKFMRGLRPMQNQIWRGYARLYAYDQNRANRLVMAHEDFSFTLTMGKKFGVKHDGQSEGSIKLMVAADEGTILHRD